MATTHILACLCLVLSNIVISSCDNVPHIHSIDDTKADSLLRGSGERHEDIDEIPLMLNRDIEPEKTLRENDAQNEKVLEKSGAEIDRTQNTSIQTDNINLTEDVEQTKDNIDLITTTDKVQTSTNTEESSLKNEDTDYIAEVAQEADEEEPVSSTDLPETTTEDVATSSNSVYKTTDTLPSTNNMDNSKPEPTTSTTTVKEPVSPRIADELEPVVPSVSGLDGDHEYSPRVAKTDNAPQPKVQDKRLFETFTPTHIQPAASKSETLKRWLEDSWLRPPAGILVPLRPMALSRALAVWNDLIAEGLNITDIVIVGYDSNGVNWRSRHNLQPTRASKSDKTVAEALSKLILKYQGVDDSANDSTMRALASASKLVPYDSALFLVTDKGAGDPQRYSQAVRALVEKRLKVFTIWTDPKYPSEASEKQLRDLYNISRHTEGEALPYSMQVMDVEDNSAEHPHWDNMMSERKGKTIFKDQEYDTLLVRRGGGEAISLGLPVENGVSMMRIFIEGLVEHAVLYPPNDAPQVDLYNLTSIHAFSPTSRTEGMSPRDVYLMFPGTCADYDALKVIPAKPPTTPPPSAPTVGMWHLSVRCDSCDYRLIVTARSHVHLYVHEEKNKLKFRVMGPVSSIRESMLVDEYGTELAKLPFSYQPMAADGQELPLAGISTELSAEVPLPSVKGSRIYAKIVGRDVRGEPFTRLAGPLHQELRTSRSASYQDNDLEQAEDYNSRAYNNGLRFDETSEDYNSRANNNGLRYNETSIVPYNRAVSQVVNQRGSLLTAVQIGLSSRLYGAPGDNIQLHFEVTNYRDQNVYFRFEAVGELRFLTGISPSAQTIAAGQTANVIVSVGITTSAQPGARDFITFTAYGRDTVSISAYVYVTNVGESSTDVWSPELRHIFQGSCVGKQGSDCAQYVWSATVYARDTVSGLLRLSSSPVGLMYDSNFISGTREQVIATYRATCCAPRFIVTAVDAQGNANSYVVDISNYVTEAGIAAIVLGILLFIAIVAMVVFLIHWCVKRRKDSKELPYMTSTRRDLS